jgi:hypothetical protein
VRDICDGLQHFLKLGFVFDVLEEIGDEPFDFEFDDVLVADLLRL